MATSGWSPAPDKAQWGGQSYEPVYEPGPAMNYGGPSYGYGGPPPPQAGYVSDSKSPYDGGRFAPKKRINDWAFLLLFIAQVSIPMCVRRYVVLKSTRCSLSAL